MLINSKTAFHRDGPFVFPLVAPRFKIRSRVSVAGPRLAGGRVGQHVSRLPTNCLTRRASAFDLARTTSRLAIAGSVGSLFETRRIYLGSTE